MNKYEAMFILHPSLNEEELTGLKSSVSQRIEKNEGKITETQDIGKKKLAFTIKKQKDGFYYLVNFEAVAAFIKEFRKFCHLNENILRVLILRREI